MFAKLHRHITFGNVSNGRCWGFFYHYLRYWTPAKMLFFFDVDEYIFANAGSPVDIGCTKFHYCQVGKRDLNLGSTAIHYWKSSTGFVPSDLAISGSIYPDSKVHGTNLGPTWVLSAPDGPHVGPMNLAIWVPYTGSQVMVSGRNFAMNLGAHYANFPKLSGGSYVKNHYQIMSQFCTCHYSAVANSWPD